jgi:hypothetical protein
MKRELTASVVFPSLLGTTRASTWSTCTLTRSAAFDQLRWQIMLVFGGLPGLVQGTLLVLGVERPALTYSAAKVSLDRVQDFLNKVSCAGVIACTTLTRHTHGAFGRIRRSTGLT